MTPDLAGGGWPLWLTSAAALTFASSVHCLGMCGGFAIAVQGAGGRGATRLVLHQGLLHAGKTATYAFLGAAAGLAGQRLTSVTASASFVPSPMLSSASRVLAVAAGVAILGAAVTLLGAGRAGPASGAVAGWLAPVLSRVVEPLLSRRPPGAALVVGLVMGLLPCPLVVAGLLAAAATASPLGGLVTMAGVGLGTVPALTVAALAGLAFPAEHRRRWATAAGAVLLVAGGITLARGIAPAHRHASHGAASPAGARPAGASPAPAAPAATGHEHHR